MARAAEDKISTYRAYLSIERFLRNKITKAARFATKKNGLVRQEGHQKFIFASSLLNMIDNISLQDT